MMSSPEYVHWQARYHKERENGGPDRAGQWVVVVTYQNRRFDRYFADETAADAYVSERGLEGQVPVFEVPDFLSS